MKVGQQPLIPATPLGKQLAALLVVAVLLGGGGVAYALNNLAIQLAALAILAFNRVPFFLFWNEAPLTLRVLVGASVALPLLQLVPLPHSLTTGLPGRSHLAETMQLLGVEAWFPLSLGPHRTLVAASALIVPLTILSLGWSLDRKELRSLVLVLIPLGIFVALLGFAQVLSGDQSLLFYPENLMPGVLFGTFANRNTAGIFAVALLCLVMIPAWRRLSGPRQLARWMMAALLLLTAFLTQSRTAIVLCAIPIGFTFLRLACGAWFANTHEKATPGRVAVLVTAGLVAALAGLGVFALSSSSRVESVIDRFEQGGAARAYIWEDAVYSAQRYWPVGSGMGTFDEVFQADESLENLTVKRAGRAHNDYLELAIEGGLPALALLLGWMVYCIRATIAALRSRDRWYAWASSGVLAAIALQSITDYPLRNLTMLALAALALLFLATKAEDQGA